MNDVVHSLRHCADVAPTPPGQARAADGPVQSTANRSEAALEWSEVLPSGVNAYLGPGICTNGVNAAG
ncbi:hypothetical protein KVA01_10180 [Kocuria varians]|uniref:Uncharacterized protein n=1 Tax=Kocuria varians TaxID=1272 RepID=A0A4Y4D5N0_KOCVA|nr:hypothetical protein KVA01_10180 [Kocuria varians]